MREVALNGLQASGNPLLELLARRCRRFIQAYRRNRNTLRWLRAEMRVLWPGARRYMIAAVL